MTLPEKIRFIDLFAGMGGTRIGFEQACEDLGLKHECVFTSEIKPYAVDVYKENFKNEEVNGDIGSIPSSKIPNFDFLLAGFPCQAFSSAGTRKGFMDTRGTLFFEVERILKDKKPTGFLLENVEGLVSHDKEHPADDVGRTLSTILEHLRKLKYHVTWKVVNSAEHGVPQNRSRIYIVGRLDKEIKFHKFKKSTKTLGDILEQGLKTLETDFTRKLFSHYTPDQLNGKAIKDKRGGKDNIHSWDIESKGPTSKEQRELLNLLLKQRRRKKWAERKGIDWMDGMPLTYKEIREFYNPNTLLNAGVDLKSILDDLVDKGYLRFEHPKKICEITGENGHSHKVREYALDKEKGYNIVVGKLSFEISKILDPKGYAPTLTATDVTRLAVVDGNGLRRLTIREGLRVSGFPESYTASIPYNKLFDLVGNTVMVPVIHQVAVKLLS